MIDERSGLSEGLNRGDVTLLPIAGRAVALSLGSVLVNNLVMLGVYTEIVKPIPSVMIEEELHRRYQDRSEVLRRNLHAFKGGLELGRDLRGT